MKIWVSVTVTLTMAIVGCQQVPPVDAPIPEGGTAEKPQGYQALPGVAATSSTPSETATAFEFAAAALATNSNSASRAPSPGSEGSAMPATPRVAPPALPRQLSIPSDMPAAPPIPDPRPVDDDEQPTSTDSSLSGGSATISAGSSRQVGSGSGYAVQVTNGTSGRLYVEAKDDSGNIFPFGFMYAGQRIASQPQDNRPIQGHLQVIIRDPDQPGAPELRRYNVAPPANYDGKTVGVTILPGGRYRASVDGNVYYKSPEPLPSLPPVE